MKQRNGSENGDQTKKSDSRKEDTAYAHTDCGGKTVPARDGQGSASNQNEARSGTHGAKCEDYRDAQYCSK
jgi:hypothetical protein